MFNDYLYNKNLMDTINNIKHIRTFKDKKILVTGSTGLIGSAIIDTLIYANVNNGFNINIYAAGRCEDKVKKRFKQYFHKDFFTFVKYDAKNDLEFDFKVDYIIHGASNAHPIAYSTNPVETMISNLYGINNLLRYAKNSNMPRILYISSSEVYGQKNDDDSYSEDDYGYIDILNPRACYPSSKKAAETLCSSYIKEYNLDIVIVRPGHIYGPTMTFNDSRVFAQFARNVISGEDIIMKSPGLQLRSYCYVFDCVSAILTVLLEGLSGQAYNISNKDSIVTIRRLAKSFANSCGKKIIFENPNDIESLGYNMMSNSSLNSEKLEGLGWKGLYDIDEGVDMTVQILKNSQEL